VTSAMRDILATLGHESIEHPYFLGHQADRPKRLFIVFAGDKGLCGAYNHNVLEFARLAIANTQNPSLLTVGIEAREYFKRRMIKTNGYVLRFPLEQSLHNARLIVMAVKDLFDRKDVDEVYTVHTEFFGKDKNKPLERQILPILEGMHGLKPVEGENMAEIQYLPSAKETFDLLIPQYLIGIVYDTLVQAYAGEQFARMNAMDASTQNADEILKDLRQSYNLARQASITNEITEVSAAALMQEKQREGI
jgi:F-type H+-transporting ATPase subunit gamma